MVRSEVLRRDIASSSTGSIRFHSEGLEFSGDLSAAISAASRSRRRRHEREAAEMAALKSPENSKPSEWNLMEPVLDEAMSRLSTSDRTILLLRYWQDQTTIELAAALGITDDTARKRLSRATDRLRKLLTRDGATVSAATLGPLLSANVLTPAPT